MSNTFNFGAMKVRTKNAKRDSFPNQPSGQSYTGIKYQVNNDGKFNFTMATKLFESLGLSEKALMFAVDGSTILVAVVSEDHATAAIYKSNKSKDGKKSMKFMSNNFKNDLLEAGLIQAVDATTLEARKPSRQYLSLIPLVQEGIPDYMEQVFTLTVDGAKTASIGDDSDDSDNEEFEEVEEVIPVAVITEGDDEEDGF